MFGATIIAQDSLQQQNTWNWQLSIMGSLVFENTESIQNVINSRLELKAARTLYGLGLEVEKNQFFLVLNYASGTSQDENQLEQIILHDAMYSAAVGYSWYPWGKESVRLAPQLGYLLRTMGIHSISKGNSGSLVPILSSQYTSYGDSFAVLGLKIDTNTKQFGDFFLFPARLGVIASGAQSLDAAFWQGRLQNGRPSDYQLIEQFLSISAIIAWEL